MSEKTQPEINMEKIAGNFSKATERAKEAVNDKEKAQDILDKAMKKASEVKGPLEKVWESLTLMFGIVADWIKGKYKDVPLGSIIGIIGALIYFLSPIDAIPDFIPVIGYLDDVFVIGLVIAQVSSDLEKYKAWKDSQKA